MPPRALYSRPLLRPSLQLLRFLDRGAPRRAGGRVSRGARAPSCRCVLPCGAGRGRHDLSRRRNSLAARRERGRASDRARRERGFRSRLTRRVTRRGESRGLSDRGRRGLARCRREPTLTRRAEFDDASLSGCIARTTPRRSAAVVAPVAPRGIDNMSLDLIFALPESTGARLERDVERRVALEPRTCRCTDSRSNRRRRWARWIARGERTRSARGAIRGRVPHRGRAARRGRVRALRGLELRAPGMRSRHNSAYWRACRTSGSARRRTSSTARCGAGTSAPTRPG